MNLKYQVEKGLALMNRCIKLIRSSVLKNITVLCYSLNIHQSFFILLFHSIHTEYGIRGNMNTAQISACME